jgi:hypothetical protein
VHALPISAVDAINPAFRHTKQQLLQPFRFGQWARLALVGLLSGELGFGGCNSSFNWPATHHPRGSGQVIHAALPSQHSQWAPLSQLAILAQHPVLGAGLITLLIVAGLVLLVLLIYISSVMRFILFDSVVLKECHLRKGWARHRQHGFQLFGWQILVMLTSLAGFTAVFGIPAASAWALGWFRYPREHIWGLVLGGSVFLMLFFALLLTLGVVHVMTKDFVVPQMALENLSAMEGWRRLWSWIKAEKVGYGAYIGMKIVLAIGAGVVLGIITVIILLAVLIPIGGAGAIAVIGGAAAGLTWTFYTIALAVIAGVIGFALIMFAVSFISVPATVFFPAYSLYFLAPRYPALAALLGLPAAASVVGAPLPPASAPWG